MAVGRRVLALALLAGGLLTALASPAAAHGRGSDATNFFSTVTEAPDLPGVRWRIAGGDEYLEVSNDSGTALVVEGYEQEPYLRIDGDGVFENANSPARLLNRGRYTTALPPGERPDASAAPVWVQVSDQPRYAWHDHRVHWMSPQLPQAVGDGSLPAVIEDRWEVPFTYGGQDLQVAGALTWVPGRSPWPWLAAALVVTAPAAWGLLRRSHRAVDGEGDDAWVVGLARPAAVVVAAVTALNSIHLVDDLLATPVPLAVELLAAGQTALFLALAAVGALKGWQGRQGAFTALGVGAGALLVGQGLLYLAALTASQTASVFPQAVGRAVVAASLTQAVWVGAVAVVGTRRLLPPLDRELLDVPAGRAVRS